MRVLVAALLCGLLLPAVPMQANPLVPYCAGSVAAVNPEAAPSVLMPDVCKAVTGRVFPEASPASTPAGQLPASDYVSFFEAEAGLRYLDAQYPDWMEIHEVATSYGLPTATGVDQFPVYAVEVTNEKSPVPLANRQQLLFMLSIHGVEKGGREGGLRVIEDFVSNMGMALETVQNGAGMGSDLAKPTGGNVVTYRDLLDFTRMVFLFPNSDGWAHDELPYIATSGPSCGKPPNGVSFCRTNGNGTDLNRQLPTIGWQYINPDEGRIPVNEPEPAGYLPWLVQNFEFDYAIDIHGMLNHANFAAIMMPAGSLTPQEMLRSTRLAETLKERLNLDPHFSQWTTAMAAASTGTAPAQGVTGPACEFSGQCDPGAPASEAAGSGEFADWGTVWDAIGYTDSGFSGDFFAQNTGLNAPGYDIELAYNHITTDSQYEGPGQLFNDYHVAVVRHIVKSFMDAAAQDVQVSIETHGTRTAYIRPTYVATNTDDVVDGNAQTTPGGWADQNPKDDLWDYGLDQPFAATPAKYWTDLAPFLRDGDKPGVLVGLEGSAVTPDALSSFDQLVIPGSAIDELSDGAVADIKAWAEAGGNLVLTDKALTFLDRAGITAGDVDVNPQYAGAIAMDRNHALTAGVRGFARQTYEPVPLGFSIASNSAPAWYVAASALSSVGGEAAGFAVQGQAGSGIPDMVTLGELPLGDGQVRFIGAILPDPSEEFYHPYGVDDYASTYSGNQILRNMLGWEEVFKAPPVIVRDDGTIEQSDNEAPVPVTSETPTSSATKGTPAATLLVSLVALAAALVALRRRS